MGKRAAALGRGRRARAAGAGRGAGRSAGGGRVPLRPAPGARRLADAHAARPRPRGRRHRARGRRGCDARQGRRSRRLLLGAAVRRLSVLRRGARGALRPARQDHFRNQLPVRRDAAARARAGPRALPRAPPASRSTRWSTSPARSSSIATTPFEALATLGCAVVTGVGAVLDGRQGAGRRERRRHRRGRRRAERRAGRRHRRRRQDRRRSTATGPPLAFARQFGATDTVEAASNLAEAIRDLHRRAARTSSSTRWARPRRWPRRSAAREKAARSLSPDCHGSTPWRRCPCSRLSCRTSG